jgi:hypothetical protein
MVARYYRAKRNHFAHLAAGNCAPEGYLHRLAKLTFAETYRACLANGEPFYIRRWIDGTCNHFSEQYGFTCSKRVRRFVELTRYFDRVEVEAPNKGFRADVLLSSSHRPEVLMIEIAVTHECEPEKLACGVRIIEVRIKSEEDARSFVNKRISARSLDVRFHNFVEPTGPTDICGGACGRKLRIFRVYASGKSVMLEKTPPEHAALHRQSVVHEGVSPSGEHAKIGYLFRDHVRAAYFAGVPVVNCFLCRFHGSGGGEAAIFCKLFKEPVQSNNAVDCGHYRPVDARELEEIAQRNAAFEHKRFARRTEW